MSTIKLVTEAEQERIELTRLFAKVKNVAADITHGNVSDALALLQLLELTDLNVRLRNVK